MPDPRVRRVSEAGYPRRAGPRGGPRPPARPTIDLARIDLAGSSAQAYQNPPQTADQARTIVARKVRVGRLTCVERAPASCGAYALVKGRTFVSQSTSWFGLRLWVQTRPGPTRSMTSPSPDFTVAIIPLVIRRVVTWMPSS